MRAICELGWVTRSPTEKMSCARDARSGFWTVGVGPSAGPPDASWGQPVNTEEAVDETPGGAVMMEGAATLIGGLLALAFATWTIRGEARRRGSVWRALRSFWRSGTRF